MMLNTKPPGERTRFSHPDCYAHRLNDCGVADPNRSPAGMIDREHYISENLQKRIGDFVVVSGQAWQNGQSHRLPTKNALAANILCNRHNVALSPLDAHITDLYDALKSWRDGTPVGEHVFDGIDIERWALKVLLGYAMSGAAAFQGLRIRVSAGVPLDYLQVLFGDLEFVPGGGMFVLPAMPQDDDGVGQFAFTTLHALPGHPQQPNALLGVAIRILDFKFMIIVPRTPTRGRKSVYRPSVVKLGDEGVLKFNWNEPSTGRAVTLTREGGFQ